MEKIDSSSQKMMMKMEEVVENRIEVVVEDVMEKIKDMEDVNTRSYYPNK